VGLIISVEREYIIEELGGSLFLTDVPSAFSATFSSVSTCYQAFCVVSYSLFMFFG